jgi:hypothetical protein
LRVMVIIVACNIINNTRINRPEMHYFDMNGGLPKPFSKMLAANY